MFYFYKEQLMEDYSPNLLIQQIVPVNKIELMLINSI